MAHNILAQVSTEHFYVWIPVIIAIITSVLAPYVLSKRQGAENFSTNILQEGAEMRKELRLRIENLEKRLDDAQKEMNSALDSIRLLKSENERCHEMLDDLQKTVRAQVASATKYETQVNIEPEGDNS